MLTLYGLKTCDTCRKARRWLDDAGVDYRYHDVRADGLDAALLTRWFADRDWQEFVNRKSRTWRTIPEPLRAELDAERAAALLREHPTLAKRPVLERETVLAVGFAAERYAELFTG